MKEYKLSPEQIKKLKELQKEVIETSQVAQTAVALAQSKQKSINDLIEFTCLLIGFDKAKAKINLEEGHITEEEVEVIEDSRK